MQDLWCYQWFDQGALLMFSLKDARRERKTSAPGTVSFGHWCAPSTFLGHDWVASRQGGLHAAVLMASGPAVRLASGPALWGASRGQVIYNLSQLVPRLSPTRHSRQCKLAALFLHSAGAAHSQLKLSQQTPILPITYIKWFIYWLGNIFIYHSERHTYNVTHTHTHTHTHIVNWCRVNHKTGYMVTKITVYNLLCVINSIY